MARDWCPAVPWVAALRDSSVGVGGWVGGWAGGWVEERKKRVCGWRRGRSVCVGVPLSLYILSPYMGVSFLLSPTHPPTHPPLYTDRSPTSSSSAVPWALTLSRAKYVPPTHPPTHPYPTAAHSNRSFLLYPLIRLLTYSFMYPSTYPPTHPPIGERGTGARGQGKVCGDDEWGRTTKIEWVGGWSGG